MREKVEHFFSGAVCMEVCGENRERFMNLCKSAEIYIWNLQIGSSYCLWMSLEDFFRIKNIVRKTKSRVRIKEKYGLPFLLYRYRKRKMFFAGIILSFLIMYVLSLSIWDMQVEGNYSHSDEEILRFLKEQDVLPGIKKKELDCEKLEKALRNQFFDITWVSVEVSGTRMIIHMKENEEQLIKNTDNQNESNTEASDIVATKDAIVTNIIMRSGTPAVTLQKEVKEGDILVYGHYDIVNDAKEVVRTQYLHADADIYGQVSYSYEFQLPLTYTQKEYDENEQKRFSLRVGNKILSMPEKKMENTDKITVEKQIKLNKNFYLPIFFIENEYKSYEEKEYIYTEEQAKSICEEKLSFFLQNLEKNTIQIIQNNVTIEVNGDVCVSSGEIIAIENIGRAAAVQQEEMTGESIEYHE